MRTGTSTFRNMLTPLMASLRAMSCGVETITAPADFHIVLVN